MRRPLHCRRCAGYGKIYPDDVLGMFVGGRKGILGVADMPTFKTGNMWSDFGKPNTLFVFTANSTIKKKNKCLVMGRGIAKAVRDRLDGIDAAFGKMIQMQRVPDEFGLLIISYGGRRVGAFQVKTHYSEAASPVLIKNAVNKLVAWAKGHPDITINLNYPGIGCGRLPEEVVQPILTPLPDNVCVWKFG